MQDESNDPVIALVDAVASDVESDANLHTISSLRDTVVARLRTATDTMRNNLDPNAAEKDLENAMTWLSHSPLFETYRTRLEAILGRNSYCNPKLHF